MVRLVRVWEEGWLFSSWGTPCVRVASCLAAAMEAWTPLNRASQTQSVQAEAAARVGGLNPSGLTGLQRPAAAVLTAGWLQQLSESHSYLQKGQILIRRRAHGPSNRVLVATSYNLLNHLSWSCQITG